MSDSKRGGMIGKTFKITENGKTYKCEIVDNLHCRCRHYEIKRSDGAYTRMTYSQIKRRLDI